MSSFLQRIQSYLTERRKGDESAVVEIVDKEIRVLRDVDATTQTQWLRLQRALAEQSAEPRRVSAPLLPRLVYLTAILAAVIVGAYFYFSPQNLPPDTFATERGQQTRLTLQDSSEVTLNYATRLVVQKLTPGKPRLLSLKGEAYFRVRRNETPFIVSTGFADVQVVGTEFNVRSRDGRLEVAVTHGIVKVTASKDGRDSSLTLAQNEMAVCALNEFPRKTGTILSTEYPGWMNGKMFFNRASFEAACREIEMRFDVAIKIDDRNVGNEVVTGMLNAANADSAVAALCGLAGKQFRRNGQEFLIY